MSKISIFLLAVLVLAIGSPSVGWTQPPAPPGTGPFSIQMFIGGTQYTYMTVFPPALYTDGTPIPPETPVQVRVYRWNIAERVWSPVRLEAGTGTGPWGSGGAGIVGQAFINFIAITPVDCLPPRVIVLGVTAVVGGVESPVMNTANLTFRYAGPPPPNDPIPFDSYPCVPFLERFVAPGAALPPDQVPPPNMAPPGMAPPPSPPPSTPPAPPAPAPTPTSPPLVAPTGPPRINEVRPVLGAVRSAEERVPGSLRNMQIAIRGTNFDPVTPANNVVTFNGVEAPILGISSVEIRTEVPVGAASGPVNVTVAGQASNAVDFTITSIYANAVVGEDVRFGREGLPDLLQAILGAPDHDGPVGTGTPATDIGIGIGGSIVVDLGEGQEVVDNPGNDLIVYERGGGSDESLANEGYEVLVSNDPTSGFVSLGTAFGKDRGVGDGFDLSRSGLASARYVRIVDDGDDTTPNGADFDAVEVGSIAAPSPPEETPLADALDLIFVIDLTKSMADDIKNVKKTAVDILDTLTTEFADYRVAIVGYRDWGEEPMFEDFPFSSNKDTIIANINSLTVSGGGDRPEAVLEALLRAIESSSVGGWREYLHKQIVLMGDAPPHDPITQGPHSGQTIADVALAAELADPVVINTIAVRSDEETRKAFEDLAVRTSGAASQAEKAEDVPRAIINTIGKIAGKPGPAVASPVSVEVEPNNHFGQPNLIAPSGVVTGTIDPLKDADWYEIVVDRGGEAHVRITDMAPELDIVFRVWNADKDVIRDWQSPSEKGGDVDTFVDLPGPGKYVLEVRDSYDDASSTQPYRLHTEFTPIIDSGEPNDSFGTAAPLNPGSPLQANILPRRDHDWYKIEATGRSELQVLITNVDPEMDIVFRVWNANKEVILDWQAPLRKGADTEAIVDFPHAGMYYLEVADSHDDQRSAQPYNLQTTLTPMVDAGEQNDTFGSADPLQVGQAVQGTILPRRDHDWYKIEVPGRAEIQVLITNVAPELDIVFRVWNADKEVILDWQAPLRKGADTEATVDFPHAGTYYLELADSHDDQRSAQPYIVQTIFTPVVDAEKQNDSFGSAVPIQVGQALQASILPRRDHDWYSVLIPAEAELQVDITDSPEKLDLVFRLWNADKRVILDWQKPLRLGGDVTGVVPISEPGLYYIEVADSHDDARSPESYTLKVILKSE